MTLVTWTRRVLWVAAVMFTALAVVAGVRHNRALMIAWVILAVLQYWLLLNGLDVLMRFAERHGTWRVEKRPLEEPDDEQD